MSIRPIEADNKSRNRRSESSIPTFGSCKAKVSSLRRLDAMPTKRFDYPIEKLIQGVVRLTKKPDTKEPGFSGKVRKFLSGPGSRSPRFVNPLADGSSRLSNRVRGLSIKP
ncbi:MAG: hypothetical protein O3C43_02265 [Verrucomicrobia bacterium]|nr:hypothetical protein [Verrucomicrobiota bacterium]